MRAQVTVVIHRIVSDRFEAEELLSRTTVVDPQQLAYVDSLRRIMLESDQRLLDVGREFALLMVRCCSCFFLFWAKRREC